MFVYDFFKALSNDKREKCSVKIPVPEIYRSSLSKVFLFLKYYDDDPFELGEVTSATNSVKDILNDSWYCDFLSMEKNELVNCYRAAVYLDVEPLITLLEANLKIITLRSFADDEKDEITIDKVVECIVSGNVGEIEWDIVALVMNEDAVRMKESDVKKLDIQLPHRICKPFKYTMLDVEDATDGTTAGATKRFKHSFTKFDLLHKLHAAVADQAQVGQQGMINAKDVTQTEFGCVYNEKKENSEEQGRKHWVQGFCGSHMQVGVGEAYGDKIDEEYMKDKEMLLIVYESKPKYVIRDVMKFFTSKMDGIKYSLEAPFAGHLYEVAAAADDGWRDPSVGMHKSYPTQREAYAFKLGGRAWKLVEIILQFLGKVEFAVAPKIIKRFQAIKASPDLTIYLHLYVIWATYYTEPLKNFRINIQTDQLQSLSALILSNYQQQKMLDNQSTLLNYILGITNTVNKFGFNESWPDQKLCRYGSDLNYLHITSCPDAMFFKIKLIEYDNIYQKYCDNYQVWFDISLILMQLKVMLLHFGSTINNYQFKILFNYYIDKAIDLLKKTGEEIPANLYFWKTISDKDNSLEVYLKLLKLFKLGVKAAMHKYNQRLTNRGVDWRFVMLFQITLALITSTNDLIEGLIGAVKFLFFSNTKYNYKTCGTLLSFSRNDTYTNVINNYDLNLSAQNELFNVLPSHRTLEKTLRDQHKAECVNALKYKVIQNEKEIEKKQKTQKKDLEMYNKWITWDFKESKQELLQAMSVFIQGKRNRYSAKVKFMTNVLRKFKYCTDESIVLNDYDYQDNFEDIQVAVFDLCAKYDVWGEAVAWNEAKDNELSRINTPISLYDSICMALLILLYHSFLYYHVIPPQIANHVKYY
eukprot:15212_1